ncbi:uncharacterized protein LOC132263449 [Phlebotomus argentipes]|uniref:uncharacterized protein LOC132263449 n=1 Tax=Phlebotomus argentipes TaxID=94469 RepID=UPI0028933136|nr:uncharacterized protein LOC132263449 [Phlebotomus argentipes]
MKFTRPESVSFPQVWWKFQAKDPESGQIVDYRIEDCPEDRFEEAVNLMLNYFVPDEPMNNSLGSMKDEVSLSEMKAFWMETMPQKLTLVCFKEGCSEICGLNILEISDKDESEKDHLKELKGKSLRDIFKAFLFLKAKADAYNRYNVSKYLHGLGLLTMPKYRGCGIATELLKARFPLMEALGLSLTGTLFTGPGSQAAAKRAGFTEDFAVTYESLGKEYPFVPFPNISWPVVKFMCYQLK